MNIAINLLGIKSGGGQKVASNLIQSLIKNDFFSHNFIFFVTADTYSFNLLNKNKIRKVYSIKDSITHRLYFEKFRSKMILQQNTVEVIYSLFGSGLFSKQFLHVSGVAYSNLFYPEIKFWSEFKGYRLIKKRIIDYYRLKLLLRSKGLIFENNSMALRCHSLFNYPLDRIKFIKPSISSKQISINRNNKNELEKKSKLRLLMLCGWQYNKNYLILPELASLLKREINFEIIFTAPNDSSKQYIEFIKMVNFYDVEDYIKITGTIEPNNLKQLYKSIDIVLLLSKLESFSNNIIEAWFFKKLLIISDEEWSRSICNNAALYVDREKVDEIAEKIIHLSKNTIMRNNIINEGIRELNEYPTITQKAKMEIDFLKYIVYEKGN